MIEDVVEELESENKILIEALERIEKAKWYTQAVRMTQ